MLGGSIIWTSTAATFESEVLALRRVWWIFVSIGADSVPSPVGIHGVALCSLVWLCF